MGAMEVFGSLFLGSFCTEGLIENLDDIVGAIDLGCQGDPHFEVRSRALSLPEPRQSTISIQQSAILSASCRAAVVK
jgi:hypothetical protein